MDGTDQTGGGQGPTPDPNAPVVDPGMGGQTPPVTDPATTPTPEAPVADPGMGGGTPAPEPQPSGDGSTGGNQGPTM